MATVRFGVHEGFPVLIFAQVNLQSETAGAHVGGRIAAMACWAESHMIKSNCSRLPC
jgi:hypothetical protein